MKGISFPLMAFYTPLNTGTTSQTRAYPLYRFLAAVQTGTKVWIRAESETKRMAEDSTSVREHEQ